MVSGSNTNRGWLALREERARISGLPRREPQDAFSAVVPALDKRFLKVLFR